jgi:hypothetical protein
MGLTIGGSFYRWDKNPTTNSPELTSSSGSSSLLLGLHLMVGNPDYRFIVEGYGDFAPFSFDIGQIKGMGSFSYGGLAKLSITPWVKNVNFTVQTGSKVRRSNEAHTGLSIGIGYEQTKTELYLIKEQYKNMKRDWYGNFYGYLAYSLNSIGSQMDIFVKFGGGKKSSYTVGLGIKSNMNLFF